MYSVPRLHRESAKSVNDQSVKGPTDWKWSLSIAARGGKGRIARPPGLIMVGAQDASSVGRLPRFVTRWLTVTRDPCSSNWISVLFADCFPGTRSPAVV
jgi:hypothetical protein